MQDESDVLFRNNFTAKIIWFDNQKYIKKDYLIKLNHNLVKFRIKKIHHLVNINDFTIKNTNEIHKNNIVVVDIILAKEISFLPFSQNKNLGSFLIIDKDTNNTIGCGLIETQAKKTKNFLHRIFNEIKNPNINWSI